MFISLNDVCDESLVMSSQCTGQNFQENRVTGIFAGSKVSTPTGWRFVERVEIGDQVLTFDGGMQTVVAVQCETLITRYGANGADLVIDIPEQAIGNDTCMTLMPDQDILIARETAEALFGDPYAIVSAQNMVGFRGIRAQAAQSHCKVVKLQFERDELIFANQGALLFCSGASVEASTTGTFVTDDSKKDFRVAA